jgi:S-adenosyl-L-methionine hydrolase (adenosine-forming)
MFVNRAIALLTDFGLRDVYVGVMKGAIAQINPQLSVIDITHDIPPQDIIAARFCLMDAYRYFPQETVFIAVVDPGVGTKRRPIGIEFSQGFLVGPDNGLFSGVLSQENSIRVVELTKSKYWRTPHPSSTFHGRDIFATVGAHLASGVTLEQLGDAIAPESLITLPIPTYEKTEKGFKGCIQYVDHFGNLITNIPGYFLPQKQGTVIINISKTVKNTQTKFSISLPIGQTYNDTKTGELIMLIGSHGWLEIALNGGNAQNKLGLKIGTTLDIIE